MDSHDTELVARELDGLFGLGGHQPNEGMTALARRFERVASSHPCRAELVPLVVALASDRTAPFDSVVHDLAEILLLPRGERSEYARGGFPPCGPWIFPKLMLEFAVWSRRLDQVTGDLLAPFARTRHKGKLIMPTGAVDCETGPSYIEAISKNGFFPVLGMSAPLQLVVDRKAPGNLDIIKAALAEYKSKFQGVKAK